MDHCTRRCRKSHRGGDHFIALRGGEPGRAILTTPAFRVEFSGPYAYLRMVDGKIVATQGDVKDANPGMGVHA